MSKVFFIADPHFGHRSICKYRPEFKTPEEHDEHVISKWNSVVKKRNHFVWVLGDMCIKNPKYDMKTLINRLNGTIFLITGNHCHLPYYQHPKIQIMPGVLKKYGFWLSHAPIHPQELRGHKNIHGHVHYKTIPDNNYINVCCEVINYIPLDLDDLRTEHTHPDLTQQSTFRCSEIPNNFPA